MVFLTGSVGRAAVVGLVASSAFLAAAIPAYVNQYGEECDKYGNPINQSGGHGGSHDTNENYGYPQGYKNYYKDSPYDRNHDNDRYNGQSVGYQHDHEHNEDGSHNYASYDTQDSGEDSQNSEDSGDSGSDTEYNYDDAPHPYDSEDDYDSDGYINFNIDRDRDGRFDSDHSEYPYINTHRTKIPFGEVIHSCTEPDTIAITFDGGLAGYDSDDDRAGRTIEVLDYLRDNDMVGTFFLHGNKRFESNVDVLHRMLNEGHQIGHQTMNYKDLTKLDQDEIYSEMKDLEYLFKEHLGFTPTYMRLPYLASDDEALNVLDDLKYHVIGVDIDTKDWQHNSEDGIAMSVHNFNIGFNDGRRLVLAHDRHKWVLEKLLPEMHKAITDADIRSVTVGECLGDPRENWYRRVHDDD